MAGGLAGNMQMKIIIAYHKSKANRVMCTLWRTCSTFVAPGLAGIFGGVERRRMVAAQMKLMSTLHANELNARSL